ncbi:MAG TPA: hypothetical protein VFI31_03685 [Pirellulales bacterium]|nr:hypothetical protein [Pirellulales bacterium]
MIGTFSLHRFFRTITVAAAVVSPAAADDFHVENKIYNPHDKKAQPAETTTIFASGRVYDFMEAPAETIVFDPSQDLFLLLDPNRRMMTQVTTGDVSTEITKLREAAQNHKSEAVREAAAAKFSESIDPKTGALKLTNRWMKYEVETMAPSQPQVARQYAEFADWMAQLNVLLRSADPPFPRLALNRVLRQRQELPVKITRTTSAEEKSAFRLKEKESVICSEHKILMALDKEDRERIEEAGREMHTFEKVSFEEYHRIQGEAQARAEASLKR